MPQQFTVFSASNREPNIVYNSAPAVIPAGDQNVRFTLTTLDLVAEPSTTFIYWEIQRALAEGQPFTHMISGSFAGCDGITPPRPPGRIECSITGLEGQRVRGAIYFTSAGDQRKRFGVDGETF